nr:unnamed protein product [Digitaria exilis]
MDGGLGGTASCLNVEPLLVLLVRPERSRRHAALAPPSTRCCPCSWLHPAGHWDERKSSWLHPAGDGRERI